MHGTCPLYSLHTEQYLVPSRLSKSDFCCVYLRIGSWEILHFLSYTVSSFLEKISTIEEVVKQKNEKEKKEGDKKKK